MFYIQICFFVEIQSHNDEPSVKVVYTTAKAVMRVLI